MTLARWGLGSGVHRTGALVTVVGFLVGAFALAAGTGFDLDPFDSAEIALVSITAGLGHPPGQPVYTILGRLVTRGPWPPLVALALLSIVPAAGIFAVAGREGAREVPEEPTKAQKYWPF